MKKDYFTKADASKTYFFVFLAQVAVMLILDLIFSSVQVSEKFIFPVLLLQSLMLEGAILAVVLVYNKQNNIDTFSAIDFKKKFNLVNLLICLAITAVALFLTFHFFEFVDSFVMSFGLHESSSSFSSAQSAINTWPRLIGAIIVLALVPAFVEEITFRGNVMRGLKQYTLIGAILLSSVCFAFFHLSVSKFFYQFYVGLIFAIVVSFTNDIKLSMMMHFFNNFLVVLFEFLQQRFHFMWFFKWNINIWVSVFMFVLATALIALLVYILIKRNKNEYKTHVIVKVSGKQNLISMIMLYGTMFGQFVLALAAALTPAV